MNNELFNTVKCYRHIPNFLKLFSKNLCLCACMVCACMRVLIYVSISTFVQITEKLLLCYRQCKLVNSL